MKRRPYGVETKHGVLISFNVWSCCVLFVCPKSTPPIALSKINPCENDKNIKSAKINLRENFQISKSAKINPRENYVSIKSAKINPSEKFREEKPRNREH